MSPEAVSLLQALPEHEEHRGSWLFALACNEEIAVRLLCLLGVAISMSEPDFACVLHPGDCRARVLRLVSGEIVYVDANLAWAKRQWLTVPELAASRATGIAARLNPLASDVWHVRLLHIAGLVMLPSVSVPPVPEGVDECVRPVRDGFELLVRCKWLLYPGQPVSYTRSFVQAWCAISALEGRRGLDALNRLQIIQKVGEANSAYKQNQTALYLPGPSPATDGAA